MKESRQLEVRIILNLKVPELTNISMAEAAWETNAMLLNSLGSPSHGSSHFLFSLSYIFFSSLRKLSDAFALLSSCPEKSLCHIATHHFTC